MRLLYISNEYPPETGFGGIATYTHSIAHSMAARGHDVHVVCRSAADTPNDSIDNAVHIHRISAGTYPLPQTEIFYPLRSLCRMLIPHSLVRLAWSKEAFITYKRLVQESGSFDIVEFPECGGEGFFFVHIKQSVPVVRLHTPWVMVAALDSIRDTLFDRLLLAFIEWRTVKWAHGVSSPSRALADIICKRWKCKDIHVYPNPIDTREYNLSTGTNWIFVGRIEPRKGVHLILEAYALVKESVSPPKLRIVGRPYGTFHGIDYQLYIENFIRSNNLDNCVEWIRGADHEEVKRLLLLSSTAIFPSIWENYSYACLEAMASGCTVVAADCGGFPEIISNGKNGLLFTTGNYQDLAQVLLTAFSNPDLQKTLGAEGRKTLQQRCDAALIAKHAETWYSSLVNEFVQTSIHGGVHG